MDIGSIWSKRRKVAEERLSICRECKYYKESTSQCKKCGCFMQGKTMFMDSKCPIGKWDKHIETEQK